MLPLLLELNIFIVIQYGLMYKLFIQVLITFVLYEYVYTQCVGQINLFTQDAIDAFPQKYNHCSTFDTINIGISSQSIFNLDSLKYLRKGKWMSIDNADSLKSISGLNNLQYICFFGLSLNRIYPRLESLDTVEVLQYSNNHIDADLTLFSNVRHISRRLEIWFIKSLTGLSSFTSSETFSSYLMQIKNKNNFKNILPTNIRKLYKLNIYNSDSISLEGLEQIDSIYALELNVVKNYIERGVFAQKKGIKRVKIFGMNYPHYFDALPQIDTLESLDITLRTKIDKTFPNLKHVSEFLKVANNDSLKTMDFFEDFKIPKEKRKKVELENSNDVPYHVIVTGKKNLKECKNPFLCKAIDAYPDSVLINNEGDCKLGYLKDNCEFVSVEEQNGFDHLTIYPNPTNDMLNINPNHALYDISIYDLRGQLVSKAKEKNTVDVSAFPNGLYVVCITNWNNSRFFKMMKI